MNCHKRTCSRRLLRKACKWSSCRIYWNIESWSL